MSFLETHYISGEPKRPILLYRKLLSADLCGRTAAALDEIVGKVEFQEGERLFKASRLIGCSDSDLPTDLIEIIAGVMGRPPLTARRNSRYGAGRQGWHRDSIPGAVVASIRGGLSVVEFQTHAEKIEDVRNKQPVVDFSVATRIGDVSVIGCGNRYFHRGRNLSSTLTETLVFH